MKVYCFLGFSNTIAHDQERGCWSIDLKVSIKKMSSPKPQEQFRHICWKLTLTFQAANILTFCYKETIKIAENKLRSFKKRNMNKTISRFVCFLYFELLSSLIYDTIQALALRIYWCLFPSEDCRFLQARGFPGWYKVSLKLKEYLDISVSS